MANKTKNQIERDSHRKIYERITLNSRREFCVISRLKKVAEEKEMSVNGLILQTLEVMLEEEGHPRPISKK